MFNAKPRDTNRDCMNEPINNFILERHLTNSLSRDNNGNWTLDPTAEALLNDRTRLFPNSIAPPPYSVVDDGRTPVIYPTAPPYYDNISEPPSHNNNNNNNNGGTLPRQQDRECQTSRHDSKDDLDLFRHTAPCKKIATCVAMCLAILTFLILILLLIYGKL